MEKLCHICPRDCGAARPESAARGEKCPGVCGMPTAPVVARAGLHFWEEPVISGKKGSGAVFFSGCNLRCAFCQNYEISAERRGKEITIARLREIYRELAAAGAHNLNLVTPGHYADAVWESLEPAPPLPVVYNTNGYEKVETLRRFAGKVQIYLPDMKYADADLAQRYSGAADYFPVAAAAIKEMFRQTGVYRLDADGMLQSGVIIRHLLLPGYLDNSRRVIDWVAENFRPGEIMFSLMRQYLPCGRVADGEFPELNRRVSDEEYAEISDYLFNSPIEDGFMQDGKAAEKDFIPAFNGTGV